MQRSLWLALVAVLGTAGPAAAQLPIFDGHIHYSRPDWDVYTPERALSILPSAGVRRAIVSSTPDDGTMKLYDKAPKVVIPFLRPYRTRDDMGSWHSDPAVQAYVEERLMRGIYRGIGEFHLGAANVGGQPSSASPSSQPSATSSSRRTWTRSHREAADALPEGALPLGPRRHVVPGVHSRTARRAIPEALGRARPAHGRRVGGKLDPEWRAVFVKYPDRFVVGTDTWVTSRWEVVRDYHRAVQVWLAQLPRDVAEAIAWKNGERLFPPP